jgi:hypothetical protein
MRTVDRVVIASLALAVWTLVGVLVFQPTQLSAHPDPQDCYVEITDGNGYGEMDGSEVYVHSISGQGHIYC